MAKLTVGQTVGYEIVCYDGPNGTGNIVPDPGASTFVSDTPTVVEVKSTGNQTADITGAAQGSANVQATTSTGVNAGFIDDAGNYQSGPTNFVVTAAGTIVSAVLRPAGSPLVAKP